MLLAITMTPAMANPVLMFCVERGRQESRDAAVRAADCTDTSKVLLAVASSLLLINHVAHSCRSVQTKEAPTRTRVKLSSANWDIRDTTLEDGGLPSSLRCVPLISCSLSLSVEAGSGMLLTFCRRAPLAPPLFWGGKRTVSALWPAMDTTGWHWTEVNTS